MVEPEIPNTRGVAFSCSSSSQKLGLGVFFFFFADVKSWITFFYFLFLFCIRAWDRVGERLALYLRRLWCVCLLLSNCPFRFGGVS